jgi:hypothetical protein
MTDLLGVTLFKDLEKLEDYPLLLHRAKEGTSTEGEGGGERRRERKRERGRKWGRRERRNRERGRERGEGERFLHNTICYTRLKRLHVHVARKSKLMKLIIIYTVPESVIEVEPYVLPHKESRPISLLHSASRVNDKHTT